MSKLIYFAFLTSIIGISIILFIAENKNVSVFNIKDIDESYLDQVVRVRGHVGSVILANKITIINLNDGFNSIKVIAFYNSTLIQKGMPLEVYGLVISYQGDLEIQADEIKII